MAAAVATGVTTWCRCLAITRADGVVLALTDHDRDVVTSAYPPGPAFMPAPISGAPISETPISGGSRSLGGPAIDMPVRYRAAIGGAASAMETVLGMSVGNLTVDGGMSADGITDADITAGLYDDALVTLYLVDWMTPSVWYVLLVGNVGQLRRGRAHVTTELRGLAHRLNQPTARICTRTCFHDLGDAGCTVVLSSFTDTAQSVTAADTALPRQKFTATLPDTSGTAYFSGVVKWISGANAGLAGEVKNQVLATGMTTITLHLPMPAEIAASDTFDIVKGCNKTAPVCNGTFSNLVNFGGFPRMPGVDQVYFYGDRADLNDGSSLF